MLTESVGFQYKNSESGINLDSLLSSHLLPSLSVSPSYLQLTAFTSKRTIHFLNFVDEKHFQNFIDSSKTLMAAVYPKNQIFHKKNNRILLQSYDQIWSDFGYHDNPLN